MTHDQVASTTETQSDNYRKALAQTVSDEAFSDVGLIKLTQTLADEAPAATHASDGIKKALLDTLDDGAFDHKFIDFYTEDHDSSFSREAITDSDDWESAFDSQGHSLDSEDADERLVDSYIPGRYKVNALLGSGASGQVFAIQDNNLERNIAVKFMHAEHTEDFDKTQRFINEAKNTGRLNYPGILPIHDLDFTDGALPFFTMRKVVALTLEDIIERSQEQVHSNINGFIKRTSIIIDVCEAVMYAHQQGIVHGDIKPGNISVGNCGDTVLLDWKTCSNSAQRQEEKARLIGTPIYMSPEQARKECCDELSDIYCIGGTLLHLLTLRLPLFDKNPRKFWELKKKGLYSQATALERASIPAPLLAIAEKALSSKRAQRYQSVAALRADLLAYQSAAPISAWSTTATARCRRFCATHWRVVTVLCAACCLTIIWIFMRNTEPSANAWQLLHDQQFDSAQQAILEETWDAQYFPQKSATEVIDIDLSENDYWYIDDGSLRPRPPIGGFLGYNSLRAKTGGMHMLRVTWDCMGYRHLPKLNAFLGGQDRFTGYFFELVTASDDKTPAANAHSLRFYKCNQLLLSVDLAKPLKENTTYHFQMERVDNKIRFFINDTLVVDYADISVLHGPAFQQYGFESQQEACRIDNVKAWIQPASTLVPLTAIADDFLHSGQYKLALHYYDDMRRDVTVPKDQADLALIRSAICLHKLEQHNEAAIRLEQLLLRNPLQKHALSIQRLLVDIYSSQANIVQLRQHQQQLQQYFSHSTSGAWLLQQIAQRLVQLEQAPTHAEGSTSDE